MGPLVNLLKRRKQGEKDPRKEMFIYIKFLNPNLNICLSSLPFVRNIGKML